jgi:hypothetical protein
MKEQTRLKKQTQELADGSSRERETEREKKNWDPNIPFFKGMPLMT